MARLRNKRKVAAVSREAPENTRNNQSQNTLSPEMAEEYNTQVSEEIEGRVTIKPSQERSRTVSRILGALSKLEEPTSTDLFRSCSGNIQEQQLRKPGTHWELVLKRPCYEAVFSACRTSNLNDSDQEETHHTHRRSFTRKLTRPKIYSIHNYNYVGYSQ